MRYRTTPATGKLLDELNRLSRDVEPRLELASAAARGEWREMRSRFPSAEDVDAGFVPVSDEELTVMRAKVRRFREILSVRRPLARVGMPRLGLEDLPRS